ncbi:hypothetical protein [Halomonas daqiaonensis]|uniref:Phasin protein n=1 Tax=Halomonas daqiaonensis TaxID=650850 RepID=A0A1H7FSI2_9GAMM|nr:hypothetical protein [Halomonas daqiaonensis]SEK29066.1 hypothetical protein SAMN04488129_101199 [Halomonas daqiaonensis]
MSNQKDSKTNPAMSATEPMMEWWQKQFTQGATPMTRMQLAWMQSIADTMQFEAQFLRTLAESGQRIAQTLGGDTPQTPAEMQERYQKLISEVTEAQMERMKKATELSNDFRRRVWEEV